MNMSLRKIAKSQVSFPRDYALLNLFYLVLAYISRKWTIPPSDWKAALPRVTIRFEESMSKT